jgi:hypothetical protein
MIEKIKYWKIRVLKAVEVNLGDERIVLLKSAGQNTYLKVYENAYGSHDICKIDDKCLVKLLSKYLPHNSSGKITELIKHLKE